MFDQVATDNRIEGPRSKGQLHALDVSDVDLFAETFCLFGRTLVDLDTNYLGPSFAQLPRQVARRATDVEDAAWPRQEAEKALVASIRPRVVFIEPVDGLRHGAP